MENTCVFRELQSCDEGTNLVPCSHNKRGRKIRKRNNIGLVPSFTEPNSSLGEILYVLMGTQISFFRPRTGDRAKIKYQVEQLTFV